MNNKKQYTRSAAVLLLCALLCANASALSGCSKDDGNVPPSGDESIYPDTDTENGTTDDTDETTMNDESDDEEVTVAIPPEAPGAPTVQTTQSTTKAETTTGAQTTKRAATAEPVVAKPVGGYGIVDPKSDVSPKITTAANGEERKINVAGAFAGNGEFVTVEGGDTTQSETTASQGQTFENVTEVNLSAPLMDGVECIINEVVLPSITEERALIVTSPDGLAEAGLDPTVYTDSFFSNYCLIVIDAAAMGTVASTRVISVTEDSAMLNLDVRFERTAQNGVSYRRFIIEAEKKYALHTPVLKKQYADVNASFAKSGAVGTRISMSYKLNYPSIGTTLENKYVIPALTHSTAAARSVNEAIERTIYTECGALISGYADGVPGVSSNVTYAWGQRKDNGLIWIVVYISNTGVMSLNGAHPYAFYYDPNTDKRLTAAEYLAANGLSAQKIADELNRGYSMTVAPEQIECVCVNSATSYDFIFWDGSGFYRYPLPINTAPNGVKYLYSTTDDGYYNGITVITPAGKQYNLGGLDSAVVPELSFDSTNLLMGVTYSYGGGCSFMVIGLENGRMLYDCRPSTAEVAKWYGMPQDSGIVFAPRTISGTSSSFTVLIDVTVVHNDRTVTGMMQYDSLSGKLTYLTSDGLSVGGPWMHTASGSGLSFTNGTVTRTLAGNFTGAFTVNYTSDWHYAATAYETGSFSIDFVREGQPTLTTRYSVFGIKVTDLANDKSYSMPEFTAAELCTAAGIPDIGYVNVSSLFGGWQTSDRFTVSYTLLNADGSQSVVLTATCEVSSAGISVVSLG